jgi:hypothetical protein
MVAPHVPQIMAPDSRCVGKCCTRPPWLVGNPRCLCRRASCGGLAGVERAPPPTGPQARSGATRPRARSTPLRAWGIVGAGRSGDRAGPRACSTPQKISPPAAVPAQCS